MALTVNTNISSIIAQRSFDVKETMTPEEIERNVHAIEHVLYPETIKKLLEEK